jgi:hypothetical protein
MYIVAYSAINRIYNTKGEHGPPAIERPPKKKFVSSVEIQLVIPFKPHVLFLIFRSVPESIRQAARDHVHQTQAHRRAPDDTSGTPFLQELLFASAGQEKVQTRPGRTDTRAVLLEALQIGVGGEEKDGRERHGEELERAQMLRRYEGCEQRRWKGRFCVDKFP